MRRIFFFLLTNLAVIFVLNIVVSLFGGDQVLSPYGLDVKSLLLSSLVMGFVGSIFSLLISKPMAKWSAGVKIIESPQNETEIWLIDTVKDLASRAGIGMPEVGVFQGAANAFATGAFRNDALVAVSTGLLEGMTADEIRAVLAHEIAHVANGDMVTMSLLQGVVNTFVIFLSRLLAIVATSFFSNRRDGSSSGTSHVIYVTISTVLQLVLGLLATFIVMYYSRQREYRADSGAANYLGSPQSMIQALSRLMQMQQVSLPSSLRAFGISGNFSQFFASHPPLEDRIAALQNNRYN